MILVQPRYMRRAAGALQSGVDINYLQRAQEELGGGQPVNDVYNLNPAPSPAPSGGGWLSSLQDKWANLSTVGKVAVAGGGAVAAVLLFSALSGGKRR